MKEFPQRDKNIPESIFKFLEVITLCQSGAATYVIFIASWLCYKDKLEFSEFKWLGIIGKSWDLNSMCFLWLLEHQ